MVSYGAAILIPNVFQTRSSRGVLGDICQKLRFLMNVQSSFEEFVKL